MSRRESSHFFFVHVKRVWLHLTVLFSVFVTTNATGICLLSHYVAILVGSRCQPLPVGPSRIAFVPGVTPSTRELSLILAEAHHSCSGTVLLWRLGARTLVTKPATGLSST